MKEQLAFDDVDIIMKGLPSNWRASLPQRSILHGIAECAIRRVIWECPDEQDLLGDNMQAMSYLLREDHLLMGNSGMASWTGGWSRSYLSIMFQWWKTWVGLSRAMPIEHMMRPKARIRTRQLRASSLSACEWRWTLCVCWRAKWQSVISISPSLFMRKMAYAFYSSFNLTKCKGCSMTRASSMIYVSWCISSLSTVSRRRWDLATDDHLRNEWKGANQWTSSASPEMDCDVIRLKMTDQLSESFEMKSRQHACESDPGSYDWRAYMSAGRHSSSYKLTGKKLREGLPQSRLIRMIYRP